MLTGMTTRRIVEYTFVSADGSIDVEAGGFLGYEDDDYLRDGLTQLEACEALLMGRNMYERFSKIWLVRKEHPWATRVNAMRKYVFSSKLERAEWSNTTIVRGDVAQEAAKLRAGDGGDLLIWGHTQLAEALLRSHLTDVIELAIHPVLVGSGAKLLMREGQAAKLKLVRVKQFSKIVKLTYEPEFTWKQAPQY
jgi:dihydrofolate reductase